MLACKEIVEIVSTNRNLPFMKKVELKLHLIMCKHCHSYVEQLKVMDVQYKKIFKKITNVENEHVQNLEDQIIENLKKSVK